MWKRLLKGIREYWSVWVVLFLLCFILLLFFDAVCPTRILFGMPCPGCGLTRSVSLLFKGEWKESIWMHPMGIWIFPEILLWIMEWYKRKTHRLSQYYLILWTVICVLIYCYRMPQRFPDLSPMVYEPEHLIHDLDWIWEALKSYWTVL